MISTASLNSLERLFEQSVLDNCLTEERENAKITLHETPPDIGGKRRLVVQNIASYHFRIVILTEFAEDARTIKHMAKMMRRSEREMDGQLLLDAYTETVNMISGSVNRNLASTFRHVGMSTPSFIDTACTDYLSILAPAAVKTLSLDSSELARINLTLCVCVSGKKPLDFRIDPPRHEETTTGELELF
jgi:CheY-specific phosphatase CheX